jgi:hypothetical protein
MIGASSGCLQALLATLTQFERKRGAIAVLVAA